MKKIFLVSLLFIPLLIFSPSFAEKTNPMDNTGIFADMYEAWQLSFGGTALDLEYIAFATGIILILWFIFRDK